MSDVTFDRAFQAIKSLGASTDGKSDVERLADDLDLTVEEAEELLTAVLEDAGYFSPASFFMLGVNLSARITRATMGIEGDLDA